MLIMYLWFVIRRYGVLKDWMCVLVIRSSFEDYVMDMEDKGDEVDIDWRIK